MAYPATQSEVQSETAKDDTLKEQANANVAAQLDSTGGTWSDGKTTRANGTYVVTIPTKVGYKNVPVGKVDLTAPYDVNVKGVIGLGDTITCTATYDKDMNGALQGADGGLLGGVGPYEKSDGGELNIALDQARPLGAPQRSLSSRRTARPLSAPLAPTAFTSLAPFAPLRSS